ncbi:MAG TPA: FumA C-terminus/TtdB family hydratase beta subunit [Actinomycetota bacterium]|nr:FumA C-terminus/TtdB family hydratase beta subunit [Actinomycetota bacterium]
MPVQELPDGRKRVTPPLSDADVRSLRAGDSVVVAGTVIGARDAAHQRLMALLEAGEPLPFDPDGALIYYVGPTPERPGNVIGAAGPTTAGRMDPYTEPMLAAGVKAMVGKGGRGPGVGEALRRHTAVYLAALGGGGALAARAIRAQRVIAFDDLGPEAIREIEMDDFPAWVVNDCLGGDYYAETVRPWRRDDRLPAALRDRVDPTPDGGLGGGL